MSTRTRGVPAIVSSTLLALGVALTVLGVVLMEVRHSLLTPEGLSRRAGAALADPRVSAYVADRATNAVLAAQPDLTAFRPVVAAVATATVSSHPFQRAIQVSIKSAVAGVLSEGSGKVALSIPDLGVLFRSALSQANPALAERIPPRVRGVIGELGDGWASRAIVDVLRLSRRLAGFVVALFGLGAVCIAGGFALARDRRRALLDASVHLIAAGVVLLVLRAVGGWFLQSDSADPLTREALAGVWAAVTVGMRGWALTLSLVGLVTAASAQSVLDRISFADALARFWRVVQHPPGDAWGRLGRSVLFVAVGAAAVAYPRDVLEWVTLAAGGALAFIGVREALALLVTQGAAIGNAAPRAAGTGVWRVAMVAAATALLAWGAFAMMRPAPPSVAVAAGVCNGSAALCERPLDQVTFPGAHNAMSAADVPGWMFPQHERGVAAQLTDGIRAFLIDVHYGRPAGSSVVTDLDAETTSRAKIEEAVGPEGVDAALRIRDRFAGGDLGPSGLYLCHGFCELGAQPLGPWLSTLTDFLVQHPDEVVQLVIEDYVTPEDLAAEFDRAGLSDLVYSGTGRAPWPTLRTLIDTRQRVVVMTESGRAGVPWILPAFDVMQETPYKFRNPSELSCAANRGGTLGALFQMNNWIDTTPAPKPSNAAIVNAYDALLARARRCQQERGLKPSILAVDFYRTGDVIGVARALNR
jgi:predicted secreted protein